MTKLIARSEGERDVIVTRHFAAPPDKVWHALTDTALMRKWMTSDFGPLKSLTGEATVGGTHHFIWDTDGKDMNMIATYDVLEAPSLIRHREAWPEYGYMESVIETRLSPAPGGTEMRMVITFATSEARAQALEVGMTEGMEATYANMDKLLA
ncbi:SRPBCC family protein [Paracoccus zhejiangensis]|uniref:Activator of Hsp90 ATPase homologue 1/2-like C-terminal domain-containing protein n=1 Tax=Paracoccus zhejiangensis TaxID=1077935 RepID=A0A2H5EYI5_9RHOB|nr:SRPBCC domain-containing protein [Paracoccus zhejiangensis]AUH64365.1 hypothetical protein CX676_09510 [Paracoccus zhejiangensis]